MSPFGTAFLKKKVMVSAVEEAEKVGDTRRDTEWARIRQGGGTTSSTSFGFELLMSCSESVRRVCCIFYLSGFVR